MISKVYLFGVLKKKEAFFLAGFIFFLFLM